VLRIIFSNGKTNAGGPAIFIDRDGVMNCRRPGDYVLDFSQFVFVPGIRTALRQLSVLQLPMIVISNQAAVGKGLLDRVRLEEITVRMRQALLEDGTVLTAAYYCPHRTDENCGCRKPRPDLLVEAAKDFNIDLSRSIFIGDSRTDVEAARAAGCRPVLLGGGLCGGLDTATWAADLCVALTAKELFDVAWKCLQMERATQVRSHTERNSGSDS
jgi:D-glycero-D-manno-heptose 1,7-bisphosphate phosphatase